MDISIDFDGTCVTDEYPEIGEDIGAVPVLRKLVAQGHQLILSTERSGVSLLEAVSWFDKHKIELKAIQINPEQRAWTSSQKTVADLYIDDKAAGVPRQKNIALSKHAYVDWEALEKWLQEEELLSTSR